LRVPCLIMDFNCCKYFRPVLLVLILMVGESCYGESDYRVVVKGSIERYSDRYSIAIDEEIKNQLSVEAQQFSANYCVKYASGCGRLTDETKLGNNAIDDVVHSLLDALSAPARKLEVKTLFARLATQVGSDSRDSGWLPTKAYNYVSLIFADKPKESRFALAADQGLHRFPARMSRMLYANSPKSVYLIMPDNRRLFWNAPDGIGHQYTLTMTELEFISKGSTIDVIVTDIDRFCLGREEDFPERFNSGRSKLTSDQPAAQATLTALNVQIKDNTGTCDNECETALSNAIVRAVTAWRAGCARCSPHSLIGVNVGSRTFVDTRVATALAAGDIMELPQKDLQQTLYTGLSSMTSFVPLIMRKNSSDRRCDTFLDDAKGWRKTIAVLACNSGENIEDDIVYGTLVLKGQSLSCGLQKDVLGCADTKGNVELAFEHWKFYSKYPGAEKTIYLGNGQGQALDLDQVIAHEVGHWFGLPHQPDQFARDTDDWRVNIMNPTYSLAGYCFTSGNMISLNNAADLRWSGRLGPTHCAGLRAPETQASTPLSGVRR